MGHTLTTLEGWRSLARETTLNVLGLRQNPHTDSLAYNSEYTMGNSKRCLLCNISKVYGPLGLIDSLTVPLKWLVWEVWSKKVDWDEEPPMEIISSWETLTFEWQELSCFPGTCWRKVLDMSYIYLHTLPVRLMGCLCTSLITILNQTCWCSKQM